MFVTSHTRTVKEERLHRKQRLAATFRLFAHFGFDQGVAGHISVRDPGNPEHFWVNPLARHFALMRVRDLQLVDYDGNILEGDEPINQAGFVIHSGIHQARQDIMAVCHTHSTYGKAWSSLGRLLDPLSQDACAFYEDHSVYEHYHGVVLDSEEAGNIGKALGGKKAIILQNHGLLTVGRTIEAAAWWYWSMDNAARVQLLAEAAGKPIPLPHEVAKTTQAQVGRDEGALYNFRPLYEWIVAKEPDLLEA